MASLTSGWRSRGYLPHLDQPGLVQAITFRLADALPAAKLAELEEDLRNQPPRQRDVEWRRRVEAYLDAGFGACHLRDPRVARRVEQTLWNCDAQQYRLMAWVVMPIHVHVLIEPLPGHALADVVQAWKSITAREANRILGRTGRFWQPEYFDRAIRDERHLQAAAEYIHNNPVKAGLVRRATEWAYSSAALWEANPPIGGTNSPAI